MEQLVYHAVATGNLDQVLDLVAETTRWTWGPRKEEQAEAQRAEDVVDLARGYGPNNTTLLHVCCAKGQVRTARSLLDMLAKSADVSSRHRILNKREHAKIGGYTPLHLACLSKSNAAADLAELLLEYGADPDVKDLNSGFTALHLAVRTGALDVVQVLVCAGADLLARDVFGNNPAFWLKELHPGADRQAQELLGPIKTASIEEKFFALHHNRVLRGLPTDSLPAANPLAAPRYKAFMKAKGKGKGGKKKGKKKKK